MVEKTRAMARKIDIAPTGRSAWKAGASDGLPSPTSPLDRAPSLQGWRHREAAGVGLGILAALEAQPAAAAARVSESVAIAIANAIASPRRTARLEASKLGCSGRYATSACGGSAVSSGAGKAFRVAEFLACCDLCRRPLEGKDIFMYRGERACCSMECRYHATVSDEFQEKERKRRASDSPSDVPKKKTHIFFFFFFHSFLSSRKASCSQATSFALSPFLSLILAPLDSLPWPSGLRASWTLQLSHNLRHHSPPRGAQGAAARAPGCRCEGVGAALQGRKGAAMRFGRSRAGQLRQRKLESPKRSRRKERDGRDTEPEKHKTMEGFPSYILRTSR